MLKSDDDLAVAGQPFTPGSWLSLLRRYFVFSVVAHLTWEMLQLPFFTLWNEGSAQEIAFAIVHCTAGDLIIAMSSLTAILLVFASGNWPQTSYRQTATLTVALGLAYTVFSEWLNTEIRGAWAYEDFMPVIPLIGTGLTPLLQWIVVPTIGLMWAWASVARRKQVAAPAAVRVKRLRPDIGG